MEIHSLEIIKPINIFQNTSNTNLRKANKSLFNILKVKVSNIESITEV